MRPKASDGNALTPPSFVLARPHPHLVDELRLGVGGKWVDVAGYALIVKQTGSRHDAMFGDGLYGAVEERNDRLGSLVLE